MRMSDTRSPFTTQADVVLGQFGFEILKGAAECVELKLAHLRLQQVRTWSALQFGERPRAPRSPGYG